MRTIIRKKATQFEKDYANYLSACNRLKLLNERLNDPQTWYNRHRFDDPKVTIEQMNKKVRSERKEILSKISTTEKALRKLKKGRGFLPKPRPTIPEIPPEWPPVWPPIKLPGTSKGRISPIIHTVTSRKLEIGGTIIVPSRPSSTSSSSSSSEQGCETKCGIMESSKFMTCSEGVSKFEPGFEFPETFASSGEVYGGDIENYGGEQGWFWGASYFESPPAECDDSLFWFYVSDYKDIISAGGSASYKSIYVELLIYPWNSYDDAIFERDPSSWLEFGRFYEGGQEGNFSTFQYDYSTYNIFPYPTFQRLNRGERGKVWIGLYVGLAENDEWGQSGRIWTGTNWFRLASVPFEGEQVPWPGVAYCIIPPI